MKVVFDLDGVLRDLNVYLNDKYNVPYPKIWGWKHEDKDIYDWGYYDKHKLLSESPITEYFNVAKKNIGKIEIWSHQPSHWRKGTRKWLKKHLGNYKVLYLTGDEKRERLDKEPNTLLVEDSPNFNNYDRILLIDRPYNRKIKTKNRIKNPKELETILKRNKQRS